MALAALALWAGGRESAVLAALGYVLLAVSVFWYVVPGHALTYGPHLFAFGLAAFVGDVWRWLARRGR